MDNSKKVEESLSDDYEEGEILDEDDVLDEVSSLEEYSSGELEFNRVNKGNLGTEFTEVRIVKKIKDNTKRQRKKEHICKEDSVCRKERKGKHCFARIRKDKPITLKSKVVDISLQPETDQSVNKKPDICSVVKRSTEGIKPDSSKLCQDIKSKSLKNDTKDYHEKENRLSNKKHRSSNDRERRNWRKYPEKHTRSRSRTKEYGTLRSSKSSTFHSDLDSRSKNKIVENQSKTSLLKRLVGSGNSGVKTLKDNENITITTSLLENVEGSSNEAVIKQHKNKDSLLGKPNTTTTDSTVPEIPPKRLELKWIRSLKEDKDELQLRAEALRSAWVKKFSDRKRKGIIHPKKSGVTDDSLDDFVLDSDSDDNSKIQETIPSDTIEDNNGDANFRFSDLSGDVLKTEDMVIVIQDKTVDEPIICEPALQIVTPSVSCDLSQNDSSVIILPSSSTLIPAVQNDADGIQTEHSPCNLQVEAMSPKGKGFQENNANNDKYRSQLNTSSVKPSKDNPKPNRDRRSVISRSVSKPDRKSLGKHRKKLRRKSTRESLKNALNSSEVDDEKILREQALLSLKVKANRSTNSQQNSVLSKVNADCETNTTLITSATDNASKMSSFLKDKKIAHLNESEGTGATSSDNWEDDLDEDILRAQLLSSLTKQVSESSMMFNETINVATNSNISANSKPPTTSNSKPPGLLIHRNQDKTVLRSINKKVWNSNSIIASERKNNLGDQRKVQQRYGKTGHKFIKNDPVKFVKNDSVKFLKNDSVQVPTSSQSNTIPPQVAIPQVPRLVIKLDESDSSSDDMEDINEEIKPSVQDAVISNCVPPDIEASIDLLLQEAKKNSCLAKQAEALPNELETVNKQRADMKEDQQTKEVDKSCKTSEKLTVVSDTTQDKAVKHLPAWQQEEYRRLKKQIAERENILQCTRARLVENLKEPKTDSKIGSESILKDIPDESKPPSTLSECHEAVTTTVSENLSSTEEAPTSAFSDKLKISIDLDDAQGKKSDNFHAKLPSNENNLNKKNNPSLASCSVMEDINVMNDFMNGLERNHLEFSDLKRKLARLRRLIKNTESNLAMKRKELLTEQDKIKEKDRAIATKIASITMGQTYTNEKNKLSNRMEFVVLRHKEASLRAQVLFHKLATEINNIDSVSKSKLKVQQSRGKEVKPTSPTVGKRIMIKDELHEKGKDTSEPPAKRSFSVKERTREEWDPNTPVCHFDLNGICKDEECKYQHFKTV